MKRSLPILVVLLTLVLGCQRGQNLYSDDALRYSRSADCRRSETRVADSQALTTNRHKQQAIFSDNRHNYRLCSNRPQRLLPSSSAKHERTSGKLSAAGCILKSLTLKHSFGGREGSMLRPFGFVASRDYYVIALRHIIR